MTCVLHWLNAYSLSWPKRHRNKERPQFCGGGLEQQCGGLEALAFGGKQAIASQNFLLWKGCAVIHPNRLSSLLHEVLVLVPVL